ncbi:hypothetical protein [Bradyrhizobium sp. BWC-3-1]|uniref:hypothetical protein n=1 Tax=Bradyrhizobium sp. BWC-3-1 TaxID=3080012 RepID=UPI00293E14D7|nr:hypothetical protein [Bradyrhizobium sp. BWC-3-1]WOH60149.1 hypothetical protein RX329_08555 [Bradyrhizobium sp. BWC-3-1]
MTVSEGVRFWRLRVRGFTVAGAVCLALIFVVKALDPIEFVKSFISALVLLFAFLWLCGLYCTYRYWGVFREDQGLQYAEQCLTEWATEMRIMCNPDVPPELWQRRRGQVDQGPLWADFVAKVG